MIHTNVVIYITYCLICVLNFDYIFYIITQCDALQFTCRFKHNECHFLVSGYIFRCINKSIPKYLLTIIAVSLSKACGRRIVHYMVNP